MFLNATFNRSPYTLYKMCWCSHDSHATLCWTGACVVVVLGFMVWQFIAAALCIPDTTPHVFLLGLTVRAGRDEVNLFDEKGALRASIRWANVEQGSALHAVPSTTSLTATGSEAYNDPPEVGTGTGGDQL